MSKKYKISRKITIDGNRYNIYADNETDFQVKVAMKRRDVEEGKKKISKHMLVKDWVKEWRDVYREPGIGESTLQGINAFINKRVLPYIGNRQLKEVKMTDCQRVMNSCKDMSYSTAKKTRYYLIDLFEKAKADNLVLDNPATNVTMPTTYEGSHRALTGFERRIFLSVCEKHKYGTWAFYMFATGARPGETARLQGQHIDFKGKRVFIDGTKTNRKTDKAKRWVPMTPKLEEVFSQLKLEPFKPVFRSNKGVMLNAYSLKNMWEQILKAMQIEAGCKTDYGDLQRLVGIKPIDESITAYCLRHDFCTRLCVASVPIEVAADFMGHTDTEMVYKIYRHFEQKSFDRAASCMTRYELGETKNTSVSSRGKTQGKTLNKEK